MAGVKPISIPAYRELTGFSKSTVHRLIAKGKILIYQPGGRGARVLIYPPPSDPGGGISTGQTPGSASRDAEQRGNESSSAANSVQNPRRGPRLKWKNKSLRN